MHTISPISKIRHIHFIGIGGSGMSGIAEILIKLGYQISGSDKNISTVTERLTKLGAKVFYQHSPINITATNLIVVSSAIPEDNPELIAARQQRLPIIPRAQMLAELMRFHHGLAIAGTHGKTTTTSLIAMILSAAGLDPTFVVGGILKSTDSNAQPGKGKYFVIEADESDASFLHYSPMAAVVTNLDTDHMSAYNYSLDLLQQAFIDFLHRLPFYGLAVIGIDDELTRSILPRISRPIITYGFNEDADIKLTNFKQHGLSCSFQLDLARTGQPLELQLNLPGKHNALNAAAAAILTHEYCEVPTTAIATALKNFKGVARRIQYYGERLLSGKNIKFALVDDYGHHPREIIATMQALRAAFPTRRLVLAFQPHRYTRTKYAFHDFVRALTLADQLLLMEIYAANETPIPGIDSRTIIEAIWAGGKPTAIYVQNNQELLQQLTELLQEGDLLIIQGAGSIGKIVQQLESSYPLQIEPLFT